MQRMKRSTKKGSVFLDTATLGIALLALTIVTVLVYMLISNFSSAINDEADVPDNVKEWTADQATLYVSYMDNVFMLFVGLTWIVSLMMAMEIGSSPLFGWISFGLGIFTVAFCVVVVEVYGDFSSAEGIAEFAIQFPKMLFVMTNLAKISVAYFFTLLIAYFAKSRYM